MPPSEREREREREREGERERSPGFNVELRDGAAMLGWI
jgi:hypothetical protein